MDSDDVMVITEVEVEAFQRDGATVLRQLLSQEWIERLAAGVEYNRARPSEWSHWYTNPDESGGVLERLRHMAERAPNIARWCSRAVSAELRHS